MEKNMKFNEFKGFDNIESTDTDYDIKSILVEGNNEKRIK